MNLNKMNGAQIILKALMDQGVDTVFGYPGGAVLPIYDELFKQNSIRHILVRHEQGAVHAAEGYARSTNRPGVVLVTSGPGATNAVTGLTDALMDSIPIICLTGQVPTHMIGSDAFQECDTTGITRPCTKHNYLVKDVDNLARVMHEAFYIATNGRPGPVLVDIPKDVQFADGQYSPPLRTSHRTYKPRLKPEVSEIEQAIDILMSAEKPIIYAGGGIINAGPNASKLLYEFANLADIPITLTLMGLGCYPTHHKNYLGMLGMHGTYEANMAMHGCDVMLAIGSRFDDRITGRLDAFSPNSRKVHIDIDPSSINKNIPVELGIVADAGYALEALLKAYKSRVQNKKGAYKTWHKQINDWRSIKCLDYQNSSSIIKPQHAIERLYEKSKNRRTIISTEVGQHQMWAAQYFKFDKPNHWLTSGGLGTMGYGLPAAIGAQIANPESLVIDIAGEASIMMNIQELSTAVQYRVPAKVFILNNRYLGMVRQWQELLHGGRYSESYSETLPDFVKLAEAFGCKGLRAEKPDQLDDVIDQMIDHKGPVVVDVCVDQAENCFPMIPSGKAHNEMILSADEDAIDARGKILV